MTWGYWAFLSTFLQEFGMSAGSLNHLSAKVTKYTKTAMLMGILDKSANSDNPNGKPVAVNTQRLLD